MKEYEEVDIKANPDEVFRNRASTVDEKGKRNWIYAMKPKGKLYSLRNYFSWFYFAIFFAMPFIKVNGMPFVLLNFVEAKFILFGKIFWPQDFFIFAVAMIVAIVSVVLFTVVYGRLFCGWICPQTFFMEMLFRKVEWAIEGTKSQQIKLNNSAWNTEKILKRGGKHIVFFILSFIIANTFLSYILGVDELKKIISEPISEHGLLFTGLLFFTTLFYVVYAFVREIVCTTICPYGRLQGVMFDKNTMQIAYDYERGEPRGKLKKNNTEIKGDCIDCMKCVHVCPTGIDIRNGVQMECVGCTACIDACNEVMFKINKPLGLIRYASENEIEKKEKFKFGSRLKAYTILLVALIGFMAALIVSRKSVDTFISRARGQLYQELPGNKYSNLYNAKILNKTNKEKDVAFKVENMPATIKLVSHHGVHLKSEAINETTFFIEIDMDKVLKRSTDLEIGVYENDQKIQTVKTTFLGPFK
ncbi:cytochrome c oxidase accessory protein CcoG [Polluticaenibacter yanchengensis]|uniref:Cytochrome c oxidase accessory protein CcoG n=1 Tax=Polluticaenibacter yanchengensis TaxID=3014562 RepID=A0ABT4UFJ8_9BACT|nr:cytochrome c oxidase accessory protein CcoG [Chitinophagaceae bacterium LY-5]